MRFLIEWLFKFLAINLLSFIIISAIIWSLYNQYESFTKSTFENNLQAKLSYFDNGLKNISSRPGTASYLSKLNELTDNIQTLLLEELKNQSAINIQLHKLISGKKETTLLSLKHTNPKENLSSNFLPASWNALINQPKTTQALLTSADNNHLISGDIEYKNIYAFAWSQQHWITPTIIATSLLSMLIAGFWLRHHDTLDSEHQDRIESIFANSRDWLWEIDRYGNLIYCSDSCAKVLGFSPDQMIGKSIFEFLDPLSAETDRKNLETLIANEASADSLEILFSSAYGEQTMVDMNIQVKKDAKNKIVGLIGVGRDVTKNKKERQNILNQVYFDSLTKLPNRESLNRQLETHLKEVIQRKDLILSALVLLDLDDFKDINHFQNQRFGDEVLKELAQRLRVFFGDKDVIFRLTSDQFIVLIVSPNRMIMTEFKNKLQLLIAELLHNINKPIHFNEQTVRITASAGVLFLPQDGRDASEILAHAETAVQQAKKDGKNCYRYFDASLHALLDQKKKIAKELKRAIKNHEFELHYQLQIDSHTDQVYGMEALVRWRSPDKDVLIPPNEFLQIADESNQIQAIDEWVIEQSFRELKKLQETTQQTISVSINLSAKTLENKELPKIIKEKMQAFFLSPSDIRIEVTETSILNNIDQTIHIIEELKELGVETSIDDFGTGYSSLAYLQRLPVDSLKIDKSFIDGISKNNKDMQICKSIIQLGKTLEKKLIAEGVQSEQQKELLNAEGCTIIQGYLYSKPMPINDVIMYLAKQSFSSQGLIKHVKL